MTPILEKSAMPSEISESRAQIVRLCYSLTGDREIAEDLAQETMVEALRCSSRLQNPEAADAWLAGIARNVCQRYFRRSAVERHRAEQEQTPAMSDPWDELERKEQAGLLDKAMEMLPEPARLILAARYWKEMPLAEIAVLIGCTENTAAVRLGRARESLRVVLSTRLHPEAAAFGLVAADSSCWLPTRVWCFRCGECKLEERLAEGGSFRVRCPRCDGAEGDVAFSTLHAGMDRAQVLGTVQSCKPALRRISAWWDLRLRRGLVSGTLSCWQCTGEMTLDSRQRTEPVGSFWHQAVFHCGRCGSDFSLPASGLAFHSAQVQRFWQRHPRLRVLPEQQVQFGRKPAIVTCYQAVGSLETMELVYDAGTLRPVAASNGVS